MNVSLNWLSEHLDLSDFSIQQIDDLLTFAGIEVEGIESKGIPSDKIVVAQIKEAVQHPDADKLKVTQVDAGEGQLRQIVCGAKNYNVGDKVPCCLPGASLGSFTIGETKMRGVESKGMLAAASEIGLPDSEDGLMILPADAEVGKPLVEMFASDTIIEVEVTPNRPDLLSHSGMARELGALLGQVPKKLEIPTAKTLSTDSEIKISAPEQCPLYTAVKISGAKVEASPTWLKTKLEAIGLTPINNVVDITNYVLHELGHPLHAFDAAKVSGELVIRHANEDEAFVALDGSEHALKTEDLVISDNSGKVLALAGVMGGLESGVTESTTDIILEAAYFSPSTIRKTSRRTALSTDSSYRFERGTDPQQVLVSSSFAVKLIKEITGGNTTNATGDTLVQGTAPQLTNPVELNVEKLHQLAGDDIPLETAESILSKLGLEKAEIDGNVWNIPSFRLDLPRHIDLVEEIVRVHGFDKITSRYNATFVAESDVDVTYDYQLNVKKQLAAQGFYEIQGMKLISKEAIDNTVAQLKDSLPLRPLIDGDLISVSLPLSEDHAIMRPSLVPSLVATAARNIRQGAKALNFFEIGKQFRNAGGGKATDLEAESLSILISGDTAPLNWANKKPAITDLFDLKAIIAHLLPKAVIQFNQRERDGFIIAADVLVNGKPIGIAAQLSPKRCREIDSNSPIFVAELDIKKFQQLATVLEKVSELPQFPGSSRDAAMEATLKLSNADIEKAITKHNEPLLQNFYCFDLFTDPSGEKLAADKKSIAYSFFYRDDKKTLKAKDVDNAHQKLLDYLQKSLGIAFR